jgi:CrcB protein
MTPKVLTTIALGGALGSVLRYLMAVSLRPVSPAWPLGTLAVNVIGSLAIGFLWAWFAARPASDAVRLGLITGILGGFTTFSAFSIETLELLRTGGNTAALGYVAITLVTGLGACAVGLWLARLLA